MPPEPQTIVDLLVRASTSANTGLRLLGRHDEATWMPWTEIFRRACSTARAIRQLGVRPSDRVALVFPTDPDYIDAFFGVLLAGAVPVPLYPPVRLGRLDEYRLRTAAMLGAVEAQLVLCDPRMSGLLGQVTRGVLPHLACRTLDALPQPKAAAGDPGGATPDEAPFAPPSAGDLGLVQFSSGTTRDPKPVALTHRALVAQAVLLNSFWPDTEQARHSGVSWLPLYHDMGLIGCVFTALERAATLTLIPPEIFVSRPSVWLQAISKYRASISAGPNFGYSFALHRIADEEMDGVDLSCWRVAPCGAETVVADVLRGFAERFGRWGFAADALTPVYGLSEAALAVTFSDPGCPFVSRRFDRDMLAAAGIARETDDGREIVSVGRPVPGFDVRIVGESDRVLPEGRVGLIECRGPSLMEGYLGRPDATAEALRDGWLATGDLGFVFEGELYVAGRRKDMLVVRGANYSPDEVERAALRAEGVRAGCAVAVSWLPEAAEGERLLVFVEAARGVRRERFGDVRSACEREILAATGLSADEVVVLPPGVLPRTSSGKLRRQDTLQRYLDKSLFTARRLPSIATLWLLTLHRLSRAIARLARR